VLHHPIDTVCLIAIIDQAGESAEEAHLFVRGLVHLVHHFITAVYVIFAW
jgi:hypothetical protein